MSSETLSKLIIKLVLAALVRLILIISPYKELIANRVEISTLLNSWRRVVEGVSLYREGINPYDGDLFHETPIGLVVFDFILAYIPNYISVIFIACDLITGLSLYWTACEYMKEMEEKQNAEKDTYAENASELLLNEHYFQFSPKYVLIVYLFNPYNILNCVGFTTTTFGNLCLAVAFLSMIKGWRISCCLALGLNVYQTFYTIVLIIPVCIYIAQKENRKILSVLCTVTVFTSAMAGIFYISTIISNDWRFLRSVYVVILTVTDLRPNIGLFWYFFTEMFEHFRLLFIFSFQLNATLLYLAPLSLRFHKNPMLLATSLTALIAVFKSYPCLGDVGFYLSLLPMWKHLYSKMQQAFIILCALIVTSVLGPTVWYLWIYSRSANANFYFGVTLAFATAQIFLITDLLFAYIKREFSLKRGLIANDEKMVLIN